MDGEPKVETVLMADLSPAQRDMVSAIAGAGGTPTSQGSGERRLLLARSLLSVPLKLNQYNLSFELTFISWGGCGSVICRSKVNPSRPLTLSPRASSLQWKLSPNDPTGQVPPATSCSRVVESGSPGVGHLPNGLGALPAGSGERQNGVQGQAFLHDVFGGIV